MYNILFSDLFVILMEMVTSLTSCLDFSICLQTQVMICALNNRIRNIENSLEIEEIPDEEQAPEGGSHVPIKAPSDLHKGASRGEGSKQQTSLQDKVTSQHIDSGSGAVQNGRQYTTGKRVQGTTSNSRE